jgi:hypothetical protein
MSDYKTYEVRVYADGRKEWLFNGQLHREDGPAIERADGLKQWYLNGKLHREDGPAIEYADGEKRWYLNDRQYSEKGFHAEMARRKGTKATCEGKIVEIEGKKYKLVSA